MPPAIASITSVNDVRAIDRSYSVSSVLTRNTGCLPFTDQMACCTSVSRPSVPVRFERITNSAATGDELIVAAQVSVHQRRQVRELRRLHVHAVVVDVFDDAHDFAPGSDGAFANPLAQSGTRIAPPLPRQILRHDGDVPFVIQIGPGEVPSRDDPRSHRSEESRGNQADSSGRGPGPSGASCPRHRDAGCFESPITIPAVRALANPTEVTPGRAASLSRISSYIRITRSGSFAMASGIEECTIWISSGCVNPGCTPRNC